MMYCKGIGCRLRQHCARYTIRLKETDADRWITHCYGGRRYIKAE